MSNLFKGPNLEGEVILALQQFVIICAYPSQINFNWSKSVPILKSVVLVVSKNKQSHIHI